LVRRHLAGLARGWRRHGKRAALQIAAIAEQVGRLVGSEQYDARLQEIDAGRRKPSPPQRTQTELDGCARGERDEASRILGYADAGEPQLHAARGRELDNGVLDAKLDARHFFVESALHGL